MKKPTLISILLFVIFLIINRFQFDDLEGSFENIRYFHGIYNWKIYIPINYILLLFSLIEIWNLRKKLKLNILSLLFLTPIVLREVSFLVKIFFSLLS